MINLTDAWNNIGNYMSQIWQILSKLQLGLIWRKHYWVNEWIARQDYDWTSKKSKETRPSKQYKFCIYNDKSFDSRGFQSGLIGPGGLGGPGGPGGPGGQATQGSPGGQVVRW